jgi:hypothetical protein
MAAAHCSRTSDRTTVLGVGPKDFARDPRGGLMLPTVLGVVFGVFAREDTRRDGGYTRCGDRSPGAFWCPAMMESVDRWPLATPSVKIPGGSRPVGAAARRRDRGVRTPHLRTICRSLTAPARTICSGYPACGLALKGSVGAIGWSQRRPVRRECRCRPDELVRPFQTC